MARSPLGPVAAERIIRECHLFVTNRRDWIDYYQRRPEHIAVESLTQWSQIFEFAGIHYEPFHGSILEILEWI